MFNREIFSQLIRHRAFLAAFIVSAVVCSAVIIMCALYIRPSDIQVPMRYSAFGITNIYRSQWVEEFAFPGLAVLMFVLNTLVSIKLYRFKGPDFATAYQWLTAITFGIAFLMILAVFRVIAIVQ